MIKRACAIFLFYLFRLFPINKKKIVVSCFDGQGYGDCAKPICDRLLKTKDYSIVWLCKDKQAIFPKGIKVVKYLSIASIYEQVTAKIWIDNKRKHPYVRKRRGQYYMTFCHGCGGLKKVEFDVEKELPPIYIKSAINDSKMADLFIASSKVDTMIYRNAYRFYGEILETGNPRLDVFFNDNTERVKLIKNTVGIKDNQKVLLYAPTFRKDSYEGNLSVYAIDWEIILNACSNRFGGEWVGMIRLHPNIYQLSDKLVTSSSVKNVTTYPDFDELLLISDCVVSDYSSTIIEAGITDRIGFFYAPDIEEYRKDRDFYIQPEEFPFPFAKSNCQLEKNILSFDEKLYKRAVKSFFYDSNYGLVKLGNSTEKIVDRIISVIEGDYKWQGKL